MILKGSVCKKFKNLNIECNEMPRKPIAEKPMTGAERVRRHREKKSDVEQVGIDAAIAEWSTSHVSYMCKGYYNSYLAEIDKFKKYRNRFPDIRKAATEVKRLEKQIEELEWSLSMARSDKEFLFKKLSGQNKSHAQFSVDDIKLLRQLCHPDKHNQSQASNNASILLNKMLAKS